MAGLYRLYVDESGDHHFYDFSNPKNNAPSLRYLALMGVAFDEEERLRASEEFEQLKRKHFGYDPDNPVILHRLDIINKKGPFRPLRNAAKEQAFNEELLGFLGKLDCILFLIIIDKKTHFEKHGELAFHPYHYSLTALMERYCGFLNFRNRRGDIMAESRGGKEDKYLKEEYRCRFEHGTYFLSSGVFQKALTSKEIKLNKKEANIFGLQVADLLAHPQKQQYLIENKIIESPSDVFGSKVCEVTNSKFNVHVYKRFTEGYGKKFII